MPDRYTTERDPRRNTADRTSRPAARTGSAPRSASAQSQARRPAQGARPAAARPAGTRPPQGRPAQSRPSQGRRPAPRRRKKRVQPRFFIIAAIVVALIVVLIIVLSGKNKDVVNQPQATPAPVTNASGMGNAVVSSSQSNGAEDTGATTQDASDVSTQDAGYSTLSEWLGDSDTEVEALADEDRVQVSDLSINTSLPDTWTNFLLLGTDERTSNENSRTDSMIICSINNTTGEVKLTSIMRDLAVKFDDLGKYSGTYRINAANYFGGPNYAMKTVNECFGLNIQYYATVNFFGFQKIAEALGGIEVDITEAEKDAINKNLLNQYHIANAVGENAPTLEEDFLETYGSNTHLTGHQTLAYARIRSVDSDFSRAERQRNVLVKLMNKLRGKSAAEILALVGSLSSNVTTNMDINTIATVAISVLSSGMSNVESFRLPANNTYVEERRNEQAMLYDCDWQTNSLALYNFIYE